MPAQQRPLSNQNWNQRSIQSFGPKFRLDMNNPQMGLNGTDVYNLYAVTDSKDVCITGLSEGGLYKIYNDHSIEIIAGQKAESTGVDINIVGRNGDITITAEKNGSVRIRGSNIVLDADESVKIKAGKDVVIENGGRFLIQGNEASCDALTGNLAPKGSSFLETVFEGTYVGEDVIGKLTGGALKLF